MLAPGMAGLFAAPVMRMRLADYVAEQDDADALRAELQSLIMQLWHEYVQQRPPLDDAFPHDGNEPNDDFYRFQNGGGGSRVPGLFAGETGQRVVVALAAAVHDYMERVRRVNDDYGQHVRQHLRGTDLGLIEDDTEPQRAPVLPEHMAVWASVHEECTSMHDTHVHPGATVSGVLHVRVPRSAGRLVFSDPRGFQPLFDHTRIQHVPIEGEVVIFPPWLPHSVAPARGGCRARSNEPRVSLSFNYYAPPVDEHEQRDHYPGEDTASFHVAADVGAPERGENSRSPAHDEV